MAEPTTTEKCREKIWASGAWHSHECLRPIWKDGKCKIHHPESIAKRKKERDEKYEKKRRTDKIHAIAAAKSLLEYNGYEVTKKDAP